MRIVIAPDAFKGTLTAAAAAEAMAAGIRAQLPDATIVQIPLADGGEGTADLVQRALGGRFRYEILYSSDSSGDFALIESARWIGFRPQNADAANDPLTRGSAPLGHAITQALDAGLRDLRIALGGTGTVDGGLGMLMALGGEGFDADDQSVSPDLNGLMRLQRWDGSRLDARLREARITILADVSNTLCGADGAVYGFGAQKELAATIMPAAEAAMQRWATMLQAGHAASAEGAGAAGGIGMALMQLGGRYRAGAAYLIALAGLEAAIAAADWVITGEGRSDRQTLKGKLPIQVALCAKRFNKPVALIAGDLQHRPQLAPYFDRIHTCRRAGQSSASAIANAAAGVQRAAFEWAQLL